MTTDFRALCVELTDCLEKADWPHKQKHVFEQWIYIARKALAEPEPEGPTKAELRQVFDDQSGYINDEQVMWWSDFHAAARAVLARWGNYPGSPDSSPQPIPVSERLPGPGDCDAKGRCWIGRPEYTFPMGDTGRWGHADPEWCLEEPHEAANSTAVWLPAHALPVPADD